MAQKIIRTREELTADFRDVEGRFSALVESCSREQLSWHPAQQGWSIAECVEHLALANTQYVAAMKTAITENSGPVVSPDIPLSTAGWFSAFFVRTMGPQTKSKYRAPKRIRPASVEPERALQMLLASYQQVRNLLASGPQPDLNRLRFENPFSPVVRFTVSSGLLIMAAHNRRHLQQAERVREAQGFPQTMSKSL
jgi:hypothetical protein